MVPHAWSKTPEENQTADPRGRVQKNWNANSMGASVRGLMATAACSRDDATGTLLATLGANNVYTVQTNEGLIDPATQINGLTPAITKPFTLRLMFDTALSGITLDTSGVATNPAMIVIDGAAKVPLQNLFGAALANGDLVANTPYELLGDTIVAGAFTRARILDLVASALATVQASGFVKPWIQYVGGNYTPTVPPGKTRALVKAWGAAGAGGSSLGGVHGGGGGGGGGYVEDYLTGLVPGSTIPVTVGTGGLAQPPGDAPGNPGTDTTVGAALRASAGQGGSYGANAAGGAPGIGSGSSIGKNLRGTQGGPSIGNNTAGGTGGSAPFGGSGSAGGSGVAGGGPGGAGGGAGSAITSSGSPGADGGVEIHWL